MMTKALWTIRQHKWVQNREKGHDSSHLRNVNIFLEDEVVILFVSPQAGHEDLAVAFDSTFQT